MFLIGRFNREYFSWDSNKNPLTDTKLCENVTKEDLIEAQKDDDFQVINLITHQYFDPKQNTWINIKRK